MNKTEPDFNSVEELKVYTSKLIKIRKDNVNALYESLYIIHVNCHGIKNKVIVYYSFVDKEKPHILSLNEIKCNEPSANYTLNFKGYMTYYKCRKYKSRGGGVSLLVI